MRHFRDEAGVEWQVFLTARGSDAVSREHSLPEAFREGWLVFESASEKRRLAPVPADWETMPIDSLRALCAQAVPQTSRSRVSTEGKGAPTPTPTPTPSAPASPPSPLRPQLKEAEHQLDKTLAEVCETPTTASRLDTGDLIRVEESLALAASAAKEAVSLRRRMKADHDRSDRVEPQRGDAAAGGGGPPADGEHRDSR